jgi:hypothetical protein
MRPESENLPDLIEYYDLVRKCPFTIRRKYQKIALSEGIKKAIIAFRQESSMKPPDFEQDTYLDHTDEKSLIIYMVIRYKRERYMVRMYKFKLC